MRITPDTRLNALIVEAPPADLDNLEQLLRILDRPESPEQNTIEPKPRIIPVRNTQASDVAEIVKQIYPDRLAGPAGARQPTPQDFIQALAAGRGGGRRGGGGGSRRGAQQEEQSKLSIGVDSRTNSLIVSAPDKLFNDVKSLVEELDQDAGDTNNQEIKVVALHNTNLYTIQSALASIGGPNLQVNRSGMGSGQYGSMARQGGYPGMGTGGMRTGGFGAPGFGAAGGFPQRFGGGAPGGFPGSGGMGGLPGGMFGGGMGGFPGGMFGGGMGGFPGGMGGGGGFRGMGGGGGGFPGAMGGGGGGFRGGMGGGGYGNRGAGGGAGY
jgi:hypothetical protein